MTQIAGDAASRSHLPAIQLLLRWLSCIRYDEVAALQATPFVGAVFSVGALSAGHVLTGAIMMAGNLCLMAHVFVLNDWSGIFGDLKDPDRAGRTFAAKGLTRTEVGYLAGSLLVISLLLLALVGTGTLLIAATIAGLSALYSSPALHLKAAPLFSSALHFVGGCLHFLLGYTAFGAIDAQGVVVSCFFGLVFTAGHFTHEARDHEVDLINGIRTNAVAFGKTQSFVAGLMLFISSYIYLVVLAALGFVPIALVLAAALIPLHLLASRRAMRAGLTSESLRGLQRCYRALFATIGIGMILMVALS
ncbi:UbiA family prenyltransferase [Mesorhizobium sp. BR1-1-3]|uniref:UbiA family prenyltransferase n=1 Tax=Mesorhizobium sp. BR1-1-3 TaxID=2876651 RepID=UPI001CD11385|nr:UbiA family prenyltransferase [Mesorhizobium sp. BR1-1-3]MBZ9890183.1 UbiA family prenyltransferase [Mesorhizobium sp. BR1-1-3]